MKSSVSANARTMGQPKSATVSVENAGSVKGLSAWALATVAIAAWGLTGGTLLLLEGLKIREPSGPCNSLVLRDSVRKIWHLVPPRRELLRPGTRVLRHPHRPRACKRRRIRQLEALGYKVTFQPAA